VSEVSLKESVGRGKGRLTGVCSVFPLVFWPAFPFAQDELFLPFLVELRLFVLFGGAENTVGDSIGLKFVLVEDTGVETDDEESGRQLEGVVDAGS